MDFYSALDNIIWPAYIRQGREWDVLSSSGMDSIGIRVILPRCFSSPARSYMVARSV